MKRETWEQAVAFHGHACPGLAIGLRAAEVVRQRLQPDEKDPMSLVCVAENSGCPIDGIQILLGCTAGKSNLKFRLTGAPGMALSFFNQNSGESLRLALKKEVQRSDDPARQLKWVLQAGEEELFDIDKPPYPCPEGGIVA